MNIKNDIIKQFKLSCHRINAQIKSMTVRNANFTAQIQNFTSTTYIMIVSKDISIGSIDFNIERVRSYFEMNGKNE